MLQKAGQSRRLLRTELQNTTSANTGKVEPLFTANKLQEREVAFRKITWMITDFFSWSEWKL